MASPVPSVRDVDTVALTAAVGDLATSGDHREADGEAADRVAVRVLHPHRRLGCHRLAGSPVQQGVARGLDRGRLKSDRRCLEGDRGEPRGDRAEKLLTSAGAETPAGEGLPLRIGSAGAGSTLPPPPLWTTQLKVTPGTPLPNASTTRATIESGKVAPTGPVCPSPKAFSTATAEPGSAVAVKSSGEPETPESVAWLVCGPAVGPSSQTISAWPDASVVEVRSLTSRHPRRSSR